MDKAIIQVENALVAVIRASGLQWSDKINNIMVEALREIADNQGSVEDSVEELQQEFNTSIHVDRIIKTTKKGRLITEPWIISDQTKQALTLYHDNEHFWIQKWTEPKILEDTDAIIMSNDNELMEKFINTWLNNWSTTRDIAEVFNKIHYIPVQQRSMMKRKIEETTAPMVVVSNTREPPTLTNIEYKSMVTWTREYRTYLKQGNHLHPRLALGNGALGQLRAVWKRYAAEIDAPPIEEEPKIEPIQWLAIALNLYTKLEGRGGAQRGIHERIRMTRNAEGKPEYVKYNTIFSQILDEQPHVNQDNLIKTYIEGVRQFPTLYNALEDEIADWNRESTKYDLNDIMVWVASQLGGLFRWTDKGDIVTFCKDTVKNKQEFKRSKDRHETTHQSQIRCTKCGKIGHKSLECRSTINLRLCAICFKPNHIARECPTANTGRGNEKVNSNTNQRQTTPTQVAPANNSAVNQLDTRKK